MVNSKLGVLIVVVFGIVETLQKLGLAQKYAHLLALPLGILGSFLFLQFPSSTEHIIYGIFVGLTSVGTCNAFCNVVSNIKDQDDEA